MSCEYRPKDLSNLLILYLENVITACHPSKRFFINTLHQMMEILAQKYDSCSFCKRGGAWSSSSPPPRLAIIFIGCADRAALSRCFKLWYCLLDWPIFLYMMNAKPRMSAVTMTTTAINMSCSTQFVFLIRTDKSRPGDLVKNWVAGPTVGSSPWELKYKELEQLIN